MFTFLSRFRRQTAVLTALALVASVLVAVPASAADDPPEADYTASFDACIGGAAQDAGFADVPEGHKNAGDIDCIAYYRITIGKSATTYDPKASVTREHMALFLTRLAGLVGIEVASDPADPGFTDVGALSDESQTAIAQLADLGITKGTSDTTYSPADSVTRGHMALFISRLMDQMSAVSDDDDSNGAEGSLPKDVDDGKSPFTDLGSTTKTTYDAITNLWELGVASGISDTAYAPSSSITRAAMADFMAGVLDHSNARPAGLSIGVAPISKDSGFGDTTAVLMVSVRDDSFAPVEDALVDVFSSTSGDDAFDDDGTCDTTTADVIDGDCVWNTSDEPTDGDGNIFDQVTTDQVDTEDMSTRVFYAWIGDDDTDTFDMDDENVEYVSASLTAYTVETVIDISSDVNELASTDTTNNDAPLVHLGKTSSVAYTVQLRTAEGEDGHDVARSGVKVTVQVSKGTGSVVTTTHETDEDGKITFSVEGPDDDPDNDPDPANNNASDDDRNDTIVITYMGDASIDAATERISWIEAPSTVVTATAKAGSSYVMVEADGDVNVSASVTFYDQYGAPHRQERGQLAGINFDGNDNTVDGTDLGASSGNSSVRSAGTATRSAMFEGAGSWNPDCRSLCTGPQ